MLHFPHITLNIITASNYLPQSAHALVILMFFQIGQLRARAEGPGAEGARLQRLLRQGGQVQDGHQDQRGTDRVQVHIVITIRQCVKTVPCYVSCIIDY